jgi:hypothetical protein
MRNFKPALAHMGMKAMRANGGAARADGGKTLEYTKEANVMDEAKERKDGGKAKKHVAMEGMKTKHRRLDRPGRKRGGGVGADSTPLTTAARATQASDHKADADELAHG